DGDAAKAAPQVRLDVQALGADFIAVSGHKMLGPSGIGFLWGRSEILLEMEPFLLGGHMIRNVGDEKTSWGELPAKFEAGTSPVAHAGRPPARRPPPESRSAHDGRGAPRTR